MDKPALRDQMSQRAPDLEEKAKNLAEVNMALNVLLKRLDEHKQVLNIIETNLPDIVSPFARNFSNSFMKLTPAEIQVANLIYQGKTTKEIADLTNVSINTIEFHRETSGPKLA